MKAADLIYAYFVSLDVSELNLAQLKALSAPFQLTETNLRSTLSRLHEKNMIAVRKMGRIAFYRLSPKGRQFGNNIGFHFQEPDWTTWDGSYWGAAFSESDSRSRYRIRKKLSAYRFRALYPGFWIRPYHPLENVPDVFSQLSESASFDLILCRFDHPPSPEMIKKAYMLDAVGQTLSEALMKAEQSIAMAATLSAAEAFKEHMLTGAVLVRALAQDPLLPSVLLPDGWPATRLRTAFNNWIRIIYRHSVPFVKEALKGI